ncbi:alpha/beta hydrolase [Lentisalinibacter salinarum]|uniref:alpha/beta hydrolase n=1 Tax=Lentisalinibacter salinarum TaxID=2992239 RepID=UPI0038639DEF
MPFRLTTFALTLSVSCAAAILAAAAPAAGGTLALEDCRLDAGPGLATVKARCGTLERPENPDDPDGRRIALRVAVVPALSVEPASDPVVPLAGGPGQAATDFYVAYRGAFEALRRERPILLVDQRGTGESARLTCPESEDMLEEVPEPEEIGPLVNECLDGLDADPRYYTTSVAVRDLEAVREALGYPALNLYGISYGTRVAQHYLRRYPDRTRSVVLDGVIPAGEVLGPDIALFAQAAVDAIFARCAQSEACAGRFPDVESEFAALLDRLAASPEEVTLNHPVTGEVAERRFSNQELAGAVRLLAYAPASAALLPHLIHEGARGNLSPLTAQIMMIEASMYESLAIGMHHSVVCAEDMPFVTEADIDREALGATFIGEQQLDMLREICRHWPRGPIDPDFREPLDTDVPVLLLSGEFDPVTPPAWGDRAAAQYDTARHVVGPGQGHGLLPHGCTPRLVADFVAAASVEDLEADCVSRLGPMPFFLDFNGPRP